MFVGLCPAELPESAKPESAKTMFCSTDQSLAQQEATAPLSLGRKKVNTVFFKTRFQPKHKVESVVSGRVAIDPRRTGVVLEFRKSEAVFF